MGSCNKNSCSSDELVAWRNEVDCQIAKLSAQTKQNDANIRALNTEVQDACFIDSACGDCGCTTPVAIDREIFGPNETVTGSALYAATNPCLLTVSQFKINVTSVQNSETVDLEFFLDGGSLGAAVTVSDNSSIDLKTLYSITNLSAGTLTVTATESYVDPDAAIDGLRIYLTGCCASS